MKVAICSIACNEDHYIKEWINYHKLIGVDDIFIYQNNWRYPFENNDEHVHLIEWDGFIKQIQAYNDFKDKHCDEFDFGIFIDCDEFICIKKHNDIKEFLNDYVDFAGVGLNWKNFGDSHLDFTGDYSLIPRFTLAQASVHRNYKTIVNFCKLKNNFSFINPHAINLSNAIINLNKTHYLNFGIDNAPEKSEIAQLNHYRKTYAEFFERRKIGFPDKICSKEEIDNTRNTQFTTEYVHYNEEEDLSIQNYMKLHFNNLNATNILN